MSSVHANNIPEKKTACFFIINVRVSTIWRKWDYIKIIQETRTKSQYWRSSLELTAELRSKQLAEADLLLEAAQFKKEREDWERKREKLLHDEAVEAKQIRLDTLKYQRISAKIEQEILAKKYREVFGKELPRNILEEVLIIHFLISENCLFNRK